MEFVDNDDKTARRVEKLATLTGDPLASLVNSFPGASSRLENLVNSCLACNKSREDNDGKLSTCSGCKQAHYCSRECQKADWSKHKPFCISLKPKPAPVATVIPQSTKTDDSSKYNTAKMCHGCLCFVKQIDWSDAEWDAPFKQGRCNECRGVKRIPIAPGSAAAQLAPAKLQELRSGQAALQRERSACLTAALTKTISLRGSSHMRLAPSANGSEGKANSLKQPLTQLEKYEVAWTDPETDRTSSYHFKFIGQGKHHACDLPRELESLLSDERFAQGGLLYLLPERAFWSMVFNWYHLGTTIPFPGPCGNGKCTRGNPGFVQKWKQLQAKYDGMFASALADPFSVRCMFVDTPIGCQVPDCPFAH